MKTALKIIGAILMFGAAGAAVSEGVQWFWRKLDE